MLIARARSRIRVAELRSIGDPVGMHSTVCEPFDLTLSQGLGISKIVQRVGAGNKIISLLPSIWIMRANILLMLVVKHSIYNGHFSECPRHEMEVARDKQLSYSE